jgi:hypothetical protein
MKTYFELTANKKWNQLTDLEKEQVQNRQSQLASMWQDAQDELHKRDIFDELFASLNGLVKAKARKEADRSYSVEQEDFEGILYLTLAETLVKFDRNLGKPFQPVFMYNVSNKIKMMYRDKSKDEHENTYHEDNRLDTPAPEDKTVTIADTLETQLSFEQNVEHNVVVERLITKLFNGDEKKRTVVHMSIQNFKRNEIVSAIAEEGKSTDSLARYINRTVNQFKEAYIALT